MKKIVLSLLIVFTLIGIMVSTVQAEWIYGKTLKNGLIINYYKHQDGTITPYYTTDKGVKVYQAIQPKGDIVQFSYNAEGERVYKYFAPGDSPWPILISTKHKNGIETYQIFYKDGTIKNGMKRKDGTKVYQFFDSNGATRSYIELKNGTTFFQIILTNGIIERTIRYNDGVEDKQISYPNGQIAKIIKQKDGTGNYQIFYPSGLIEKGITQKDGSEIYQIFKQNKLIVKGIKKNGINKGVVITPDGKEIPFIKSNS